MDIREVKIEEYWPLIVKGTEEFGQIAVAENPEFNLLAGHIYDVLKDSFIKEATEYGVSRWEKMLGLAVADGATLEDRKVAILTYLSVKIPYTWRVLKQMLTNLLGEDNFEISLDNDTQTLSIALALSVDHMRDKVDELCARVIPQNLVIKMQWINGLPIDYTPLEYLESDGSAMMELPFESKNKSFVCEHTLGMPKATSGLFAYGGTAVSSGYAIVYRAANQGFLFSGNDWIASGKFLRGKKYKILWKVTRNEAGKFIFGLYHEGELLKELTQSYNQYWRNVYYVFGSTKYNTRIGGATYELTISIEGELTCHVIPALDPTGAPCMFDLVTRKPFYNSGTGDFIYPNMEQQSTTYSLRKREYAQMTEHGIRRLYHVPKGCELTKEEYAEQNGFKILVETPQPEEGYWTPVWYEHEDCIELEWVETEPPVEEEVIENE